MSGLSLIEPHSFESRESCDEVIKTFNNHTIKNAGEDLQIQIRFADTQEQKSLKQQTQAARQFRSAEYEYATQAWRQGRVPASTPTGMGYDSQNEFDSYLGTAASVPIQGQRWAQSAIRQVPGLPGRSPLGPQPPLVQINVAASDQAAPSETAADSKSVATSPATAHAATPVNEAE